MPRGLVRKNNLSDLPSPEQARINLGLATADYNRIKGLYASAELTPQEIIYIANSSSNFQTQINSLSSVLSGITPALYAERSGDTLTGTWSNIGLIRANSFSTSGTISPSIDNLFVHDYQNGNFELTTAVLVANSGITVEQIIDAGNVIMASGVTTNLLVPVKIRGVQYFLEAG